MKIKYTLAVFIYLFSLRISAQFILISATHAPTVGTVAYDRYDSTSTYLPNETGAFCSWDFSKIKLLTKNFKVDKYVVPGDGSTSIFPETNLEEVYDGKFPSSYYYKSTSSVFELLGTSSDMGPFIYQDPYTIYKWPLTYGDSFSDTFAMSLGNPPAYTFCGKEFTSITGFGTLTLPNGEVRSKVMKMHKVNHTLEINDGFQGVTTATRTNISDLYFSATERYPVLIYSNVYYKGQSGNTDSVYTLMVRNPFYVGLNERDPDSQFSITPNPSNGKFLLTFSNQKSLNCNALIYNSSGQLIREVSLGHSTTIAAEIQTEGLPNGIYLLTVSNGERRSVKKLIID